MNDIADDIKEVIISKSNGEAFIIVKGEIFQATSKSDNNGIRQITGYTEYRISSYDLNTGKLSKRITLGDRKENECTFLGETDGKLWYKSVDKKLGLHARDPRTLDVIISQDKIIEVNPFLKDNISQPEWNNIGRYYGFDIDKNMPMLSDNSGYLYFIDPSSLKAEKTTESIQDFDFDNTCTSTSMKIDVNSTIYLSGTPRNYINYYNKENKEPSFLKGDFLKSSTIINMLLANPEFLGPYNRAIETYKKEIDSIKKFNEDTDTTSTDKYKNQTAKRNIEYAERNIERTIDKIKDAEDNIERYSDEKYYDILSKDNSVYVLSQNDVTDKARCIISKVRLNSDSTTSLQWQRELNDIFRDPDKGFDKSSFEIVFSKGNPVLRTMRVVTGEDKLVFVFMLKAVCLDMQTGRILWDIDL